MKLNICHNIQLVLLLIVVGLIFSSSADPACSENAWVKILPDAKTSTTVTGSFQITSGKNAQDIPQNVLQSAFSTCAFENQVCDVNKSTGRFSCVTKYAWRNLGWKCTGDIEFRCRGRLYHCYNFSWGSA